jgi:hypothetical protein
VDLSGDWALKTWFLARFRPHVPPAYPSLNKMPTDVLATWMWLDETLRSIGEKIERED